MGIESTDSEDKSSLKVVSDDRKICWTIRELGKAFVTNASTIVKLVSENYYLPLPVQRKIIVVSSKEECALSLSL